MHTIALTNRRRRRVASLSLPWSAGRFEGHDDPKDQIEQHPTPSEKEQQEEQDPDDCRINAKIAPQTRANAGDHPPVFYANQSFFFHHDLLISSNRIRLHYAGGLVKQQ